MASSSAITSSAALTELKTDLTSLSKTLHQIYELMQADMRQVNAAWQDNKYQEFVNNYQPQIQKCDEIANRYAEWCARVLDPTIENVIDVESADVGGGDGSVGGWSSAGAVGVEMAAAAGVTGAAVGFNIGANQGSRPTAKMKTNMTTPSVDVYKAKFKEKGIFFVDENGDVRTYNNKIREAINEVHGNNPEVHYEDLGKYPNKCGITDLNGCRKGNSIFLHKTLANDPRERIGAYAHENQHINQSKFCIKRENQRDPICENSNNYIKPCGKEERVKKPGTCQVQDNKYWKQPREVNAREAEANAKIAYDETLNEFIHKLEKPRR